MRRVGQLPPLRAYRAGEGWGGGIIQRMRDHVLQNRARELRKRATDAEQHLWTLLRRRQIKGFRFRRQVPIAGYIADFACLEAKLVVELDGGQHVERNAYDAEH